MGLIAGTKLGPYEILTALGAGGMGEVYKARDIRLDRTVAIKILPQALAADAQFRDRFDREARTISQLDHPHICTLYDVGEQDGTSYLVMQYLEGETLEQRLKKGALPLDQALQSAIQIADALDKAHRTGVVHRDLKPGNIMLTKTGAMLRDFGLAKARPGVGIPSGLSMLPTTPPGLTAQGTILGTFQYMAPEQLEGHEADARTDIFAFGAVLYEMVIGQKAFEGKSQASLIGAILKETPPPLATLQRRTPPALDHLVTTCLAKDSEQRWQSAGDLARELKRIADARADDREATSQKTGRRHTIAWLVGSLTVALLGGVVGWALRPAPMRSLPQRQWIVNAPPSPSVLRSPVLPDVTISPDGTRIVYAAGPGVTSSRLYLRRTEGLDATPIPGTEAGTYPVFSPDGQSLAFVDALENSIKRVPVLGGPVTTVQRFPGIFTGMTWASEKAIIFSTFTTGGLLQVSAGEVNRRDSRPPTRAAV